MKPFWKYILSFVAIFALQMIFNLLLQNKILDHELRSTRSFFAALNFPILSFFLFMLSGIIEALSLLIKKIGAINDYYSRYLFFFVGMCVTYFLFALIADQFSGYPNSFKRISILGMQFICMGGFYALMILKRNLQPSEYIEFILICSLSSSLLTVLMHFLYGSLLSLISQSPGLVGGVLVFDSLNQMITLIILGVTLKLSKILPANGEPNKIEENVQH